MWYLDNSFKYILLMALVFSLIHIIYKPMAKYIRKYILPAVFLIFLWNFSKSAAIFYITYTVIVFIIAKIILSLPEENERLKKFIFILSIIFMTIIFVSVNLIPVKKLFSDSFIFIGASYAYLKYVDIMYYAYYHEENISFFDMTGFMLFIPTFTSGPIMAFNDYKSQMNKEISKTDFETPVKRIIIGFFKKVVIVKFLYIAHDHILSGELNFFYSFITLLLFYMIGYLDFSGYSDIAIGFGSLIGFKVPENFKKPFLSPSLTIFWKNWHITLGAWVKTHITVFIKPKNRFQSALSSFLIMLFIGLWHKFSILFFLWGLWHGIFLFIEGYFNLAIVNKKKTKPIVYYARCVLTNLIVTFGCLFFYTDTETVFKILKGFLTM